MTEAEIRIWALEWVMPRQAAPGDARTLHIKAERVADWIIGKAKAEQLFPVDLEPKSVSSSGSVVGRSPFKQSVKNRVEGLDNRTDIVGSGHEASGKRRGSLDVSGSRVGAKASKIRHKKNSAEGVNSRSVASAGAPVMGAPVEASK